MPASRAVHDAVIFTDRSAKLLEVLEREYGNTSALEAVQASAVATEPNPTQHASAIGMEPETNKAKQVPKKQSVWER